MRVAVLDDYQGVAMGFADWSRVLERADVEVFRDHLADEDAVVERLAPFDVVVAMRERTPFPRGVVERLPALRLLVTTGMANASFDLDACRERGVVVCGTGGIRKDTPELAWLLVMASLRGLAGDDADVRAGRWQTRVAIPLGGSTLGLLGLGRIGAQMAAYARVFEMDVVAWSQNLTAERAEEVGAELVTKDALFERSDVVSVHLRQSERTVGLVGERELALLGPTGHLVNTSRGPIVDQDALVAALHAGTLGGAALDVFDVEPLPTGHPLLATPRTILTPHVGYVSTSAYTTFYEQVVEDVLAWMDGEPVRTL